jgi:hypothetical protein
VTLHTPLVSEDPGAGDGVLRRLGDPLGHDERREEQEGEQTWQGDARRMQEGAGMQEGALEGHDAHPDGHLAE